MNSLNPPFFFSGPAGFSQVGAAATGGRQQEVGRVSWQETGSRPHQGDTHTAVHRQRECEIDYQSCMGKEAEAELDKYIKLIRDWMPVSHRIDGNMRWNSPRKSPKKKKNTFRLVGMKHPWSKLKLFIWAHLHHLCSFVIFMIQILTDEWGDESDFLLLLHFKLSFWAPHCEIQWRQRNKYLVPGVFLQKKCWKHVHTYQTLT